MIPKFRAFIKLENAVNPMQTVAKINFEKESVTIEQGLVFKFNNVELMQSTGLKDKNGVEIYEGDIVRYTWDSPSYVNATEKGKKVRISKVFLSDWRASWAVGKKSCNSDLFRYARNGNTVEVIGNIWEDGELLEVEE